MTSVLRISEAASLALHTAVLLAANRGRVVSTVDIASVLGVSEAHLSKVLQRLNHAGLVDSVRGPRGGFVLARDPEQTSLLAVYEAVAGPLGEAECLLERTICGGGSECILGGLLHSVNQEVKGYLARTKIAQLTRVYKGQPCLGVER